MSIVVKVLESHESHVLDEVADGVFDYSVRSDSVRDFFADERHHLAVAIEGSVVVGMASAFHYVHPDKPPQMFINEVGVAPSHRRRGIGRQLMAALVQRARDLGCQQAWVATEEDNHAARKLFASAGGVEDPQRCVLYVLELPGLS